jgi:hypothetical protein
VFTSLFAIDLANANRHVIFAHPTHAGEVVLLTTLPNLDHISFRSQLQIACPPPKPYSTGTHESTNVSHIDATTWLCSAGLAVQRGNQLF